MTPEMFGNVILSLIALIGCWLLYSGAYLDYRRDVYRQKLFDLRAELFDLASSGQISFDEAIYGTVRTTINGFIRFAHRLQFGAILLYMLSDFRSSRRDDTGFFELFKEQAEDLNAEMRERLQKIVVQMHWNAIEQLVTTSPLLIVSVVPVLLVLLMKHAGKVWPYSVYVWCRSKVKATWIDAIDTEAMREGAAHVGTHNRVIAA